MTRNERIVAAYRSGLSLREVGERFGLTHQRVYSILLRDAPDAIRAPHVGMNMEPKERKNIAPSGY